MNRTQHFGRALAVVSIVALGALGPRVGAAEEGQEKTRVVPADRVRWVHGPEALPSGCQIAVIHGDPGQDGEPYTLRLKFPADYRVAAHWHPRAENVTVLSGTLNFGTGDRLDKENTKVLPAGSFFFVPAEDPHFVWNEEPTVLQLHGIGPFDITYVDPANDPRKSGGGQ